ncbi:MAG: enterotoxin [Verrucomicrobiota bacterium]
MRTFCILRACASLILTWLFPPGLALEFPGPGPGTAQAHLTDDHLSLGNQVLSCAWTTADGKLKPVEVADRIGKRTIDLQGTETFRLTLADGRSLAASELKVIGKPALETLLPKPGASILAHRFPGRQVVVHLESADGNLAVEWRAILRDGANAVRQEIAFKAKEKAIPVKETRLMELPAVGAAVVGSVPGSPVVIGNLFFAYEHPDSQSAIAERATCSLVFNVSLPPGQPVVQSSVIGVLPEGQLRRGFLYYVERERAHPYRPFLHYNAWYDICWGDRKIREAECLQVIVTFGRELIEKRGVPLASFVWDDGWDDPQTLWRPIKENFPSGFGKILAAARQHNSTLGFWLSPFGGYGKPKEDRLAMGKEQGFETGPQGFSLAGPKYYERFLETCLSFIDHDGANFFKFDGLARSVDETEAMLRLTRALRARKPDLFVSITTGTWPSPFWLWYGDSTWRGGGDMGFHGAGSKREQWVTYRDMETYRRVVSAAPLYPINSLMNQGFAHARYGSALEVGNVPEEIRRELRSLFAGGTCLQELYVTAEKMSSQNWDDLAECVKWAHPNADVLVDTHWLGGDPGKGEPYGWAAWSPRKGILALRNPSPQPAAITLDIGKAFELPPGAPRAYTLRSPWKEDAAAPALEAQAGTALSFPLEPFAVRVFDASVR